MTNKLRKLIVTKLKTVTDLSNVYYQIADESAMYPHAVFFFDGVNSVPEDNHRRDYKLYIDVYDKGNSASDCEDITDSIVEMFKATNLPQTDILPTFYLESVNHVLDEDKKIRHNQIRFTVQTYERN